ncbi:MAG: FIG00821438: hypothetical protein [uncultured Nocardioidaceae bacterium]|uniref:Uncharacterized protein n=1 Tax=uncultured Nocardioidaceae bacterium TaxID=253824 RepID=A0A6J4LVY4_9ACTN|nr:MAG: FIG00821438: hypothetical protein [uncultured Nocardioidaceae bacterium]
MRVFTHGIGGSQDLPISLPFALAGGAAALAVSFIVLVMAWRTPRFDAANQGRPLPRAVVAAVDGGWLSQLLRAFGLVFTAYVGWAAFAGPDTLANPTFGVVYVLLWVGIVPASLLLGPVFRAVSPVRTVHRLLSRVTGGRPEDSILRLPSWVGLWPAALGLLAFTWLELVFPEANYLSSVRLWFAGYAVVLLVGAAVFGDRWFAAADPFEVLSTLVGHLSPFGRTSDGTLVIRSPLRNLDGIEPQPGLVAAVSVLVGSTAFDSFSDSLAWVRYTQASTLPGVPLDTAGLVSFSVLVGVLFAAATMATAPPPHLPRRQLPGHFAHSLVPIVVGYLTAHYLTYLVEVGQQTLVRLSDPMVNGSNLLGTADLQPSYWLSLHPTLLASLKVGAIVGGHVLGVIAAHDRAMQLLPRRSQLTGQLPLLVVMVGYTVSGLYLLLTV